MREWLSVIVGLLILAVVLDGIRRMRQSRRSAVKMRLSMHKGTQKGDLENYGSELPNGGARVVNVRKEDDAHQLYRQMRQTREEKKRRLGRPRQIPEQVALNLDEQVPTLMEVEQEAAQPPAPSAPAKPARAPEAPGNDALDFADDDRIEPSISDEFYPGEVLGEAQTGPAAESAAEEDRQADQSPSQQRSREPAAEPADDLFGEIPGESAASEPEADTAEPEEELPEPEDVLVINVMAPKGEHFNGQALLETVLERGMRLGNMKIFHHHAKSEGGVLYSMANIVVPGTFDLANMQRFTTPGVSLFMTLPTEGNSSEAFEAMLTTAKSIASGLGGELKDENRSVLTAQTIEHYRSRIKEFERKQLSRAPA